MTDQKRFFMSALVLVVIGFALVLLPGAKDMLPLALILWGVSLILYAAGTAVGIPALVGWKKVFAIASLVSIIIVILLAGLILYGCATMDSIFT